MDNQLNSYSENQKLIFVASCHAKRDIRGLLIFHNWLTFRLFVHFKDGKKRHCYGNEHRVTYSQCLNQKVPDILLLKKDGFQSLVDLLEKGRFKRKFIAAKIYSKSDPLSDNFDILHREYSGTHLLAATQNDPVFTDEKMLLRKVDEYGVVKEFEFPAQKIIEYSIDERGRLQLNEKNEG